MSLLPAERAQYSAIIDGILASSDLQTISAKQIRKTLQEKLEHDVSDKKDVIKVLIMERFDYASKAAAEPHPTVETTYSSTNGHTKAESKPSATPSRTTATQTPSLPPSDSEEDISPPKKKRKIPKSEPIDDAKLARMLQEQENRGSRATRGGNVKGGKVVKKGAKGTPKRPRKKSEKKVKAEDDSELEEVGSDGEIKEKPRKGGFHKEYNLSAPLADLVGESTLSRPQTVKKIWAYIKANDLQDPADKRQIMCDAKMHSVFKTDKVHMFTMNKILGKQLYDVEEE